MSAVLVTPDCHETIRKTLAHLKAQTAHDRLEIVIVAPSKSQLWLEAADLRDFCRFRVLEVGEIKSIGAANAAGVRYSSAPVVALAEDHAFPDPAWAEALIGAHQENWAAVGPVVRNANPGSAISCADFLIAYGVWQEGVSGGIVEHLPGHNSSYKRSVLLDYGADLETMLEAESVLHWDLNRRGYRLFLEPRAKISHLNFGVLSSWLAAQFYSGRMFASIRSRDWSPVKRTIYTCASPLIPGIRFGRILRHCLQHSRKLPLRVWPALVLGLTVSALGEMIGYALGAGHARRRLTHLEFHRVRHIGRRSKPKIANDNITSARN